MALTASIDKSGTKLQITIDLISPPRASKSGKTTVLASSNGNVTTTAQYDGKPIIVGLNAYVK